MTQKVSLILDADKHAESFHHLKTVLPGWQHLQLVIQ